MTIDFNDMTHIIADEGKVLFQISGDSVMGKNVWLRTVEINGELIADTVENYIEMDEEVCL